MGREILIRHVQTNRGHIETWWLIGPDREPEEELNCPEREQIFD